MRATHAEESEIDIANSVLGVELSKKRWPAAHAGMYAPKVNAPVQRRVLSTPARCRPIIAGPPSGSTLGPGSDTLGHSLAA